MSIVGYVYCACCSDDCISSDVRIPSLCELCEEAGCECGPDASPNCERFDDTEFNGALFE